MELNGTSPLSLLSTAAIMSNGGTPTPVLQDWIFNEIDHVRAGPYILIRAKLSYHIEQRTLQKCDFFALPRNIGRPRIKDTADTFSSRSDKYQMGHLLRKTVHFSHVNFKF